ncbi:CPBP family intramembrane glutamic endopeptidase [Mycobacterium sp. M26]|uniref:Rv0804 family intramembrane glutamic endopeptidase n=1 Tax=Mycobacterium sp. M26 TaxID=1762962 RepID=UPI0009E68FFA|nr:CPBP family intramembrane glutamic endopeptidase [Mycobacterium sp. M26]
MIWRPVLRATAATAFATAARIPLGLRPPHVWSGLRHGAAAAAVAAAGVAASAAIPAVRSGMRQRELPDTATRWMMLDIPVGTVWFEETLFRGLVTAAAARAVGPRGGWLLQAMAFGLWHIPDARKAGEPVLGTVVVTGVAGLGFGWLAQRSGSLLAPMLAHLAINEAGAAAALLTQRPG